MSTTRFHAVMTLSASTPGGEKRTTVRRTITVSAGATVSEVYDYLRAEAGLGFERATVLCFDVRPDALGGAL
ncbi:hypothetical protein [Actinomadura xylanilytica]|uniref:hypothetical protein n=1 Tax=Actinomadura xylanilytica TaxID=887459 RepID=UPI00255A718B|nr:hypothetical protein [Actinomadura xylanilytica]MDL4777869.1 hypothetical protein [Actinomadura xylanilytica]